MRDQHNLSHRRDSAAAVCAWRGFLQSNTNVITQLPQVQTAADTILSRLDQVTAELSAIRAAVAPAVPGPANGADTGGAAQER